MTRVWKDTKFKGTTLLVLLSLSDQASDEGYCWPSYRTIAKRCRIDRRQVMRAVKNLEAEGWLTTSARFANSEQSSNMYKLNIPGGDTVTPPGGSGVTPVVVGKSRGGGCHVTPPVVGLSPRTVIEPLVETKKNTSGESTPPEKSLYFADVQEQFRLQREQADRDYCAGLKAQRKVLDPSEDVPF